MVESTSPRDSFDLLVGGVLASPTGDANGQIGLRLGVGYAVRFDGLEFELGGSGQLLSPLSIRNSRGRVEIAEQAAGADFELRNRGRIQLGAEFDASVRVLHAAGFLGDTEGRSAVLLVSSLCIGPELRVGVAQQAKIGLSTGAEWLPVRQRFSLAEAPVADLGRFRVDALISFIVSVP